MGVVVLAWVFFRAPNVSTVRAIMSGLFALRGGLSLGTMQVGTLVALALLVFLDLPQYRRRDHTAMLRWHWAVLGATCALLILVMTVLRSDKGVPFIYFQF